MDVAAPPHIPHLQLWYHCCLQLPSLGQTYFLLTSALLMAQVVFVGSTQRCRSQIRFNLPHNLMGYEFSFNLIAVIILYCEPCNPHEVPFQSTSTYGWK